VLAAQVVRVGDHAPASSAAASEVLHDAAAQARHRPAVPVRGDQFVYVDSLTSNVVYEGDGKNRITFESAHRTVWLSADGTRDSLMRSDGRDETIAGCRDGHRSTQKGKLTVTEECRPNPGYVGGLPSDGDAMLAYLYRGTADAGPDKNPRDQQAFTAAGDLIHEGYVEPASLAAVFDAVARIPGVTVIGDVTDKAGRPGVAVAMNEVQGDRYELIFDKATGAFLGVRSVVVRASEGVQVGDVIEATAVLKVGIVDRVGQTP
jgi:hypothetical protein